MRGVSNSNRSRRALFWTTIGFILFYCSTLYAEQVTLAWDATNPSCDGYRLYMRTTSQAYNYNSPVWTGKTTTCTIDNLAANTYYFVARAYLTDNQSGDSNEVEFKVVVNQPPVADAGTDQAVDEGAKVTLDGTGSADPDGTIASYQWTQITGPAVTLASATGTNPSFTAPNVANITTLDFKLTVSDANGMFATDTCQVTVLPVAPADPADSDNDGLTDDEEINYYGTNPNNPDSDGDGTPDGQEVSNGTDPTIDDRNTENTKIWIEAEEGDLYAPMELADDPNASAGGYIMAPEGTGNITDASSQQAGYAEYAFDVSSAGDYMIWGRVISNNAGSDSLFVSIDGGAALAWHTLMGGAETWAWDVVSSRNQNDVRDASKPVIYHLEAGVHTLRIQQREDGTKIDRILITNDKNYTPIGAGQEIVSNSLWIEAEDGNLSAPMQTANDAKASHNEYVWVPKRAGTGGYATYRFSIQEAGDFMLWGRVLAPDPASNSFNVSMDGGSNMLWSIQPGTAWTWAKMGTSSTHTLQPGQHTLRIQQRENGAKLDRILITDNMEYVPEGMGEPTN